MANLSTLRKSILNMSYEEQVALHREVRQRRRTFNPTSKAARAEVKEHKASAEKLLAKMSPDEIQSLLSKLTGGM